MNPSRPLIIVHVSLLSYLALTAYLLLYHLSRLQGPLAPTTQIPVPGIEHTRANHDLKKLSTQRKKIKRFVIQMVEEGSVSFTEYYNFFIRDPLDNRSVWRLIRYYLLNSKELEAGDIGNDAATTDEVEVFNQEYRDRVIAAGNAIYDLFAADGVTTVKKLLVKFATGKINKRWLRRWYENAELDYDNKELDYRMIELFRVLFVEKSISS